MKLKYLKLRVVYCTSAKSKKENTSLNDCVMKGPVILHDLCGVLIRFRMNEIALVADIEKHLYRFVYSIAKET